MKKIFLLFFAMIFSTNVFASEFMFESLKNFGSLNGYLAGFIVILQAIIVYMVATNVLLKAIEGLANPQLPSLISDFFTATVAITFVTQIPRIVIEAIKGMTFNGKTITNGYTSATAQIQQLSSSNGFAIIFDFIKAVNIVAIILFALIGTISVILSAMNYLGTGDIASFVRSFLISCLFIICALNFNKFSLTNVDLVFDGTEIEISQLK